MIKGIQRQMVEVNTSESRLFETAYFVLRKDAPAKNKGDMVAEANRLVASSVEQKSTSNKNRRAMISSFALGLFAGAVVGVAVTLIFCLL